ncbi:hypothetical protein [uncultured Akkermansia sp.]|uniref:hypothetical protein n=1 Tax=uncultured Akkermansia sp. TaxID=512294 RepID=UPI002630CBC2|nr:hypothetical protein [uncultured Akkermansia sp.]
MKPILCPLLLAAAIFPAPAQELPALKWTTRDQQSLMKGAWWNANPPLLPPVDAAAPSHPMPEPAANANAPPPQGPNPLSKKQNTGVDRRCAVLDLIRHTQR